MCSQLVLDALTNMFRPFPDKNLDLPMSLASMANMSVELKEWAWCVFRLQGRRKE